MKKQNECNYCSFKSADRSNFVRHLKLHIDPPTFNCVLNPKYCTKSFATKFSLNRHMMVCNDLNPTDHRHGNIKVKRVEPQPITKNPSLNLTIPIKPSWVHLRREIPQISREESESGVEELSLCLSDSEKSYEEDIIDEVNTDKSYDEMNLLTNSPRQSKRIPAAVSKKRDNECIEEFLTSEICNIQDIKVLTLPEKGRSVICTKDLKKGEFISEYRGDLIDAKEAKIRDENYSKDPNAGCYMYYFRFNERVQCVDPTSEYKYGNEIGRLLNHSSEPNVISEIYKLDGQPRIILKAKDEITSGTELEFDYADLSKESIVNFPFLARKSKKKRKTKK